MGVGVARHLLVQHLVEQLGPAVLLRGQSQRSSPSRKIPVVIPPLDPDTDLMSPRSVTELLAVSGCLSQWWLAPFTMDGLATLRGGQ